MAGLCAGHPRRPAAAISVANRSCSLSDVYPDRAHVHVDGRDKPGQDAFNHRPTLPQFKNWEVPTAIAIRAVGSYSVIYCFGYRLRSGRGSDLMRAQDFSAWLSAIAGMSVEQRREALQALTKSDGEAGASQAGAASGKGGKRGRREDALGTAGVERARASGLSPLRGPRDRRLGPLGRAFAIPLQELRAHVQRPDQNADGASAQEGEVARSRPGDDRGQKPGQDRGAVRRSSDDRVPLAASVSARAGRR